MSVANWRGQSSSSQHAGGLAIQDCSGSVSDPAFGVGVALVVESTRPPSTGPLGWAGCRGAPDIHGRPVARRAFPLRQPRQPARKPDGRDCLPRMDLGPRRLRPRLSADLARVQASGLPHRGWHYARGPGLLAGVFEFLLHSSGTGFLLGVLTIVAAPFKRGALAPVSAFSATQAPPARSAVGDRGIGRLLLVDAGRPPAGSWVGLPMRDPSDVTNPRLRARRPRRTCRHDPS